MTKKKVKTVKVAVPVIDEKAEAERAEAKKTKKSWMAYLANGGA